jgi:putative NIF3 family GTP cyclohydrolase 1 type 2
MKALPVIFSILMFSLFTGTGRGQTQASAKNLTAEEVIALILKNSGCKSIPNTVDVIKEGDPKTVVTGIITCMFATMDVLKQAAEMKCNLIIAHEPLFYNHLDDTQKLQNDPVFLEKKKFIDDHKLVIWRFHDYIHTMKPDGIESGMITKLGWKNYLVNGTTNRFDLPETTLKELLKYLRQIFPENAFYVVGKPDMKLIHVALAEGAPGSARHIMLLEEKNVDVVLGGEAQQWETYEYMRDAVAQGRQKAIIFLGHINSEEAGMNYCASWLKSFITGIPVNYLVSGPSFWSF